jgi:outer membrane protease
MIKEDDKNVKYVSIVLDQAEIALRIVEGLTGSERPDNLTPEQALGVFNDERREQLYYASKKVSEYFHEQMKAVIPTTELQKVHKGSVN